MPPTFVVTPNPLPPIDYDINMDKAKFSVRAIGIEEIREATAKIKTAKSIGIDSISSFFLKLALSFIENSLAALFNTSLETSNFPDLRKIARVTPIYKEGDKTEESNYRPILLLPVISRLFEKLAFDRLCWHMKKNNLFSPDQPGFLCNSALTCLFKNTGDWYSRLDLGQLVELAFTNLKSFWHC